MKRTQILRMRPQVVAESTPSTPLVEFFLFVVTQKHVHEEISSVLLVECMHVEATRCPVLGLVVGMSQDHHLDITPRNYSS